MTGQSGGTLPGGPAGGVLGGTYPSPTFSTNGTTPILGTVSAHMASNHVIGVGSVFEMLVTLALTAGSWSICAASIASASSGVTGAGIDLWDGVTELVQQEADLDANNIIVPYFVHAFYVAAGPVSLLLRGYGNTATTFRSVGGAPGTAFATYINALRTG